jgi:hypothetical protein
MSESTPDGMPFAEIPNKQVQSTAQQYRETADFLYDHLQEHNCVLPLLMVASFGIELFLKCLNSKCVYHQDELLAPLGGHRITALPLTTGHSLMSLLDALDDRFQFQKGLDEAYAKNPVIPGKATFKDALAEYDKLFSDARYLFEGKDISGRSITGLVRLLDLIGDYVISLPSRAVGDP